MAGLPAARLGLLVSDPGCNVLDHLKTPCQGRDLLPKPCPLCHLCCPHPLNAEPNQILPTEIFHKGRALSGSHALGGRGLGLAPQSFVSISTVALCPNDGVLIPQPSPP